MKLILPDGRELPAKNARTARLDAIIELQLQGGAKVSAENLNTNGKTSSAFAIAVMYFLTRASAGDPVKWADVMAMTPEELGTPVLEPGDPGYKDPDATEDGEAVDPTESTAEGDLVAPAAPEPVATTD